jgi:hypothetical protein
MFDQRCTKESADSAIAGDRQSNMQIVHYLDAPIDSMDLLSQSSFWLRVAAGFDIARRRTSSCRIPSWIRRRLFSLGVLSLIHASVSAVSSVVVASLAAQDSGGASHAGTLTRTPTMRESLGVTST